MAKIAKVGMKAEIWHTSSKEKPRPASQYRAIFDVLNHKMQTVKWNDNAHKQVKQDIGKIIFTSVLLFYPFSPSPSPCRPSLSLGARAYVWPGSLLSPNKTELITRSHWAWSRRIWVTATSLSLMWWMTLGKSLLSPDFSSLSTREDKTICRISSSSEFYASGMLVT